MTKDGEWSKKTCSTHFKTGDTFTLILDLKKKQISIKKRFSKEVLFGRLPIRNDIKYTIVICLYKPGDSLKILDISGLNNINTNNDEQKNDVLIKKKVTELAGKLKSQQVIKQFIHIFNVNYVIYLTLKFNLIS